VCPTLAVATRSFDATDTGSAGTDDRLDRFQQRTTSCRQQPLHHTVHPHGDRRLPQHHRRPLTQTLNGTSYEFASWSDGGAAQHDVIAPATAATYTATYQPAPTGCASGQWKASYFAHQTLSGTAAGERCEAAVDYNWGLGGPTGVGADNFSVVG